MAFLYISIALVIIGLSGTIIFGAKLSNNMDHKINN